MTPKNRIIEGKNQIKGGGGSKMTQKNRTSFMNDPKRHKTDLSSGNLTRACIKTFCESTVEVAVEGRLTVAVVEALDGRSI